MNVIMLSNVYVNVHTLHTYMERISRFIHQAPLGVRITRFQLRDCVSSHDNYSNFRVQHEPRFPSVYLAYLLSFGR